MWEAARDEEGHQRGGDAVAHRVGEEEADVFFVESFGVVDVAADETGGAEKDADAEAVDFGKVLGENLALNLSREEKFVVQAVEFRGGFGLDRVGGAEAALHFADSALAVGECVEHRRDGVGVFTRISENALVKDRSRGRLLVWLDVRSRGATDGENDAGGRKFFESPDDLEERAFRDRRGEKDQGGVPVF